MTLDSSDEEVKKLLFARDKGNTHTKEKPAVQSERSFRVNQVAPFLATLKHTVIFPIQQVSIVGDPDYLLCIRGRFVALELKREGKEPRPLQQYKLDQVKKAWGVALVASPETWEQVKGVLRDLNGGKG
jgi:hypothetical protein